MQSASLHDDPLQMVLKQKRLPPTPRHKGSVLNLLRQYYETEVPARTVSGNVQIPFEPEPVNVTLPVCRSPIPHHMLLSTSLAHLLPLSSAFDRPATNRCYWETLDSRACSRCSRCKTS